MTAGHATGENYLKNVRWVVQALIKPTDGIVIDAEFATMIYVTDASKEKE